MSTRRYDIAPQAKVKMTRRDTWARDKVRPAVRKYRDFQNAVRAAGATCQDGDAIWFQIPMPASWSEKKRSAMDGTPHRVRPDLDKCLGAWFDAVMPHASGGDAHISRLGPCRKVWGRVGAILVTSEKLTDTA